MPTSLCSAGSAQQFMLWEDRHQHFQVKLCGSDLPSELLLSSPLCFQACAKGLQTLTAGVVFLASNTHISWVESTRHLHRGMRIRY